MARLTQKLLTLIAGICVFALVTVLGAGFATATPSDPNGGTSEAGTTQEGGEDPTRPTESVTEPAPEPDIEAPDSTPAPQPPARPERTRPDRDAGTRGDDARRPGRQPGREGRGSGRGRDSDERRRPDRERDDGEEEEVEEDEEEGDDLLDEIFGAAPIAVPNVVIDNFEIPPFLLPIYQACGTQYAIPWQLLAAINKIETHFGTNLSVSTAGAMGWMQFMPGTWEAYGVDANGDGRKDPYNPVDAICAAARYLRASGGTERLRDAIFAYNRANWYVDDVLELTATYSQIPGDLISSLTGLTEGAQFPIAASAWYADQVTVREAIRKARERGGAGNVAEVLSSAPGRRSVTLFSRPHAPAVAVNDGVVESIGRTERLGNYIVLRDAYGNRFTYSGLSNVMNLYPVPRESRLTAEDFEMVTPDGDRMPAGPASTTDAPAEPQIDPESIAAAPEAEAAGNRASRAQARRTTKWAERMALRAAIEGHDHDGHGHDGDEHEGHSHDGDDHDGNDHDEHAGHDHAEAFEPLDTENARARLFARPNRPNNIERAIVSGQIEHPIAGEEEFEIFHGNSSTIIRPDSERFELQPLEEGSQVIAGTLLGRASDADSTGSGTIQFSIRPSGEGAPHIDPKPILDGWRLLSATAIYRAKRSNPFFTGIGVGQVLMLPKSSLIKRVLNDPRLEIYSCGRDDIAAGQIDRRVLAVLAYLAEQGFSLTVTSLLCGRSGVYTASGNVSNHVSGRAVDIAAINGQPIIGNQGAGSLTEAVVKSVMRLQGTMLPSELISLHDMGPPTFAMGDHADHIHIGYPALGADGTALSGGGTNQILGPNQWTRLMDQLGRIENPSVPRRPSQVATPAADEDTGGADSDAESDE